MRNKLVKLILEKDIYIGENYIKKNSPIYFEKKDIEKISFFEMANFRQNETGLSVNIFLSLKGNSKHGLRVKVQNDYNTQFKANNLFSIAVLNNNEYKIIGDIGKIKQIDIDKIIKYIELNKVVIQDFWDEKLSTKELVDKLKKLD